MALRTLSMAGKAGRDHSSLIVTLFSFAWFTLVVAPLAVIVVYSFFYTEYYSIVYSFSLDTWKSVFETHLWHVVVRTIRIAGITTLIELVIGYPFALWLGKSCRSKRSQAVILTLLTVPFFLSVASRTMIWIPILGDHGLINTVLLATGLVSHSVKWLLFSEFSVYLGMLPLYFPTMVLPIFLSVVLIEDELIEASNDLGANPWQTLWNVIIPLSAPGVLGGVILTFGPALGSWIVPTIVGGSFVNLVSNAIQSAFSSSNYPIMSALSVLVVIFLFALASLFHFVLGRSSRFLQIFGEREVE